MMVHLRRLQLETTEREFTAQVGALQKAHRQAAAELRIPPFKWDCSELWSSLNATKDVSLPNPAGSYSFLVQMVDKEGKPHMLSESVNSTEPGNHPPLKEIHPPDSAVRHGSTPTKDENSLTILIQPIVGPQQMPRCRAKIIPSAYFANLADIQPADNREYSGLEALPHVFDSLVEHTFLQLGATTNEVALYITPTKHNRLDWTSSDSARLRLQPTVCADCKRWHMVRLVEKIFWCR